VGKRSEKVLEFDLNVLEDNRCRQLEDYVNQCLANQRNAEIQKKREMERTIQYQERKEALSERGPPQHPLVPNFHQEQYLNQMQGIQESK
jgi:hypothetical protein